MERKKPKDKTDIIKNLTKFDPKSPASQHHMMIKCTCKLAKKDRKVLITYKNMKLNVMEISEDGATKTKEDKQYALGDIALFTYCSRIKDYVSKGYDVEAETDNLDELFKKTRKKTGDEKDDTEQK
jgi:hypothetical protein